MLNPADDMGAPEVMDISFLFEPRLSWKAKGLYAWLLTQQQGEPVESALAVSKDSDELVAALEELQQLGIMVIDQSPNAMLARLGGGKPVHDA